MVDWHLKFLGKSYKKLETPTRVKLGYYFAFSQRFTKGMFFKFCLDKIKPETLFSESKLKMSLPKKLFLPYTLFSEKGSKTIRISPGT